MKVAAVISEFNPFHNGHRYLVEKIKNEHADCVVAIMSGNFVQRGEVAIVDKYERAKAALQGGCDLVVELPTVFALSSAERFAKGGVQIADALNADILCFGAENEDVSKLTQIAEAFFDENFKSALKTNLSNGDYYAKAVANAIEKVLSKEHADLLSGANNTLGVEYIKALKNTNISPVAIKRLGAQHDSDITSENISSATNIRNLIRNNENCGEFADITISDYTDMKELETAILYKLRTMSKDEIENLPDVSEGLHNRIFECARTSISLEELYDNLKTKRYTLSRLRRIVMCALLGITKELNSFDAQYVRVLGMSKVGSTLLKNCKLPLLCNFPQDYNSLSDDAKKMFDLDITANSVYSLAKVNNKDFVSEYQRRIIRI